MLEKDEPKTVQPSPPLSPGKGMKGTPTEGSGQGSAVSSRPAWVTQSLRPEAQARPRSFSTNRGAASCNEDSSALAPHGPTHSSPFPSKELRSPSPQKEAGIPSLSSPSSRHTNSIGEVGPWEQVGPACQGQKLETQWGLPVAHRGAQEGPQSQPEQAKALLQAELKRVVKQ